MSLTGDFLTPGTPVDLDNCDREPIHLPGGIQPFGALLVARRSDQMIVQVSRNAGELVDGVRPGATLTDVLGADVVEMLLERVAWAAPPALHPLRTGALDASAYISGDRLVVELEPADEQLDAEQLRVLVARTTGTLQAAGSTTGLLQAAAHAVRALTGFDRVWAYRFEADDHGVVVAEDRIEELESFLGLHYPASDIPVQARALFMRNGVRVIPDAQAAPVALEPELDPETGWHEHWIGFDGEIARRWLQHRFISKNHPVLKINAEDTVLATFSRVMQSMRANRPALQQILAAMQAANQPKKPMGVPAAPNSAGPGPPSGCELCRRPARSPRGSR